MGLKITYIMRSDDDPIETTVKGVRFIAGAETDVSDPELIVTLTGNPWFRVEGEPKIIGDQSRDNRDPEPVLIVKKRGRPSNEELARRAAERAA